MEQMKPGKLEKLIILIILLLTSFLVIEGDLLNSESDPYGTTVIAQNIILNKTLVLNGVYADFFRLGGKLRYQVTRINHRIEYNYPLGTPILSIPFVFAANRIGLDALKQHRAIQKIIVFVTIFLVLLVTYLISREFLSEINSIIISILAIFGTVIGPTIGTGLWNINFEVIFIGLTFLLLIKARLSKARNPIILGVILFLGYFVRPTFAVVIICTFLYLAIKNKKALVLVAVTSFVLFILFIIFSFHIYGSYLPPYYRQALSTINALQALPGLFLSASRGILIYCPIIIIPILYSVKMYRSNRSLIFFIGIFGMASLFLINVFWPCWWGGYSYGPRILTDMAYFSIILTIIIVGSTQQHRRKTMIVFMIVLFTIGIFINLPGMYNRNALSWNAYPEISKYPQACFDWRFPQFLTISEEALQRKCVTQSKEYGIESKFPNNICPIPSTEYYQKYFSALLSSSQKFIQDGNRLSDLLPQHLENHGYLVKAFGYHTGPAKNWTQNGGWIGQWTCLDGKGKCFGIGIMGNINRLKPIIRKYQKFADQIFFPYPKVYNPSTVKGSGQLLMIFKAINSNKQLISIIPCIISFESKHNNSKRFVDSGFCTPEPWGTWSCAKQESLSFNLKEPIKKSLYLKIDFHVLAAKNHPQNLEFYLNEQLLAKKVYADNSNHKLAFDISSLAQKQNILTIKIPDAITPKELGINNDTRELGIGIISIELKNNINK